MEKNQEIMQAFMEAWKKGDHKKMFALCQLTWKEGKSQKDLENLLAGRKLNKYELISTTTISSVARKFYYELLFEDGRVIRSMVNVICEDKPYHPVTHGTWGVNPLSAINAAEILEKPEFTAAKKTIKPAAPKKAAAKKTAPKKIR